jgi:large subunit ribosomal protein L15
MRLHDLQPAKGATKAKKRKGRGVGSGLGKTAGRGSKGQNARSGGSARPGYEGGQMPLHRRLPKRGFTNIFKKNIAIINLRDLKCFEANSQVGEPELLKAGLIKGSWDGVKLLGQGDIAVPLAIKLNAISRVARQKIEAAGGSVEVI